MTWATGGASPIDLAGHSHKQLVYLKRENRLGQANCAGRIHLMEWNLSFKSYYIFYPLLPRGEGTLELSTVRLMTSTMRCYKFL